MDANLTQILTAFPLSPSATVKPFGNGRINATYRVVSGNQTFILQKLGSIIDPSVVFDIESVTEHLATHGIPVQRLVKTNDGDLCYDDGIDKWRLMTYVPGKTLDDFITAAQARSAGNFLGQFHTALLDYDKPFVHTIPHFHDADYFVSYMREVDIQSIGTEKYMRCHPLAEQIFERYATLGKPPALPLRVVHGDPKLSNFLFDEMETQTIALIDLDTVGRYPISVDVGDMLRSLCSLGNGFNQEIWDAAIAGYKESATFETPEELDAIPDGFARVNLELAARYLADAYEERVFQMDTKRFTSLFENNVAKAQRGINRHDEFFGGDN